MTSVREGTESFNEVSAQVLGETCVYIGTALPTGSANKVVQYGKFLLVDSLSAPTTATWYVQTSATLSSPNFVEIPSVTGGDELPYFPLSTTIGDYTTPSSATATSSVSSYDSATVVDNAGTTDGIALRSTNDIRGAELITDSSKRNKAIKDVKVILKKLNSPTGNISCVIRKSSDNSVVGTLSGVVAAGSVTTSYVQYTFTHSGNPVITPNENFYISIEFSGGNATNYILIQTNSSDVYANGTMWRWTSSWVSVSGDMRMEYTTGEEHPVGHVYDTSTSTRWQSNAGANQAIYVDMGSDVNMVALAIYGNANITETTVKIRANTAAEGTTFTDSTLLRTILVSKIISGQWNYILLPVRLARYLQIYGSSGSSLVMAITEIKVRNVTDAIFGLGHKHKPISISDTSIELAA